MLIVGITGSLGTGKSTVAAMFARLGAEVIDTDRIVHEQLRKDGACYHSVLRVFGSSVTGPQGIDRAKLAGLVFNNPSRLKKLVGIIHPKVYIQIKKEVAAFKKNTKVVVVEVPLLFESGFDSYVDMVIVVKAKKKDQLARAKGHLGMTRADALRRIRAQMPLRDKIRWADIIIDNSKTITQTRKQVETIWQRLLQKKKK
jgi:dephospho-CoA kinase